MELILIRHAQSMFNAGQTEHLDSQITEKGIEQAHTTGKHLKENYDFSKFKGFVSPFLRTLQTAKIINEYLKIDFEVCGGPREMLLHDHELGKKGVSVGNRSKEFGFYWPNEIWDRKDGVFYKPETFQSFMDRIKLFMGKLLVEEEKFLIISHASPVQAMYEFCLDEALHEVDDFETHEVAPKILNNWDSIHNCSLTHVIDGEVKNYAKVFYEINE